MPYIPDNVSIISLLSDSSDDEDPDIMTVISGKKSDRIATYKSARRSLRLNYINNNNTITKTHIPSNHLIQNHLILKYHQCLNMKQIKYTR